MDPFWGSGTFPVCHDAGFKTRTFWKVRKGPTLACLTKLLSKASYPVCGVGFYAVPPNSPLLSVNCRF